VQQNKVGVQSLFKRFGHFSLLGFILLGVSANAQSFEEFKQSQIKAYEDDKAKREREFRSFLSSEWKAYKESQGLKVYEKPKPKVLPVSIQEKITPVGPPVVIKTVVEKKPEIPKIVQKDEKPKIQEKPKVIKIEKNILNISLFETEFDFKIDKSLKQAHYQPENKQGITNFFDVLSSSNYTDIVDELGLHVRRYKLNDWALYLLTQKLSFKLYRDKNEAKLFQWFILNQLGYDIKVALKESEIVILSKSKKLIYSTPNYTLSKHKYYAIDYYNKEAIGSLRTYEGNYPDAVKSLDLKLSEIPKFKQDAKAKVLQFRYRGQKYSLHVSYNQNLINFMSTYPQADYESYFNAPLSYESSKSLVDALKPIINKKPAGEAINILLYFVQHAFKYEVDQEQFGREKVMFAEETLYYKKSDCEDRAVLFAYLVKNLLGFDVVGVKYSDHMATAVAVPMRGDALKIGSHRYVIADPTYINAPIGKSMPKYKNVKPQKYIVVR
jgi:hypothetical protein